jgi:hypothetical protein
MLDILGAATGERRAPIVRNAEFLRIELAPVADGTVVVSLTATTVDDEEPQLLDQEIVCDRVATIEELLALIRTHVRIAPRLA